MTRKSTVKAANAERKAERARLMNLKVLTWYVAFLAAAIVYNMFEKIRFQFGNKKLAADEKMAFIIWSLPAVLTCPGATVACMHNCYARRDERFLSVRASRAINYKLSMRPDFAELLAAAIRETIYTKKGELRKAYQGKEIVFRIHESGDFYSERYMRAWFEVAALFPDVTFFTYTKSFKIYAKCKDMKPDNFEVRASVWDDTTVEELNMIYKLGMSIYTAYDEDGVKKAIANGAMKCTCESCTKCGCACARHHNKEIVAEIH